MICNLSLDSLYLSHGDSPHAQEEGNMNTKRMILPKELAAQISNVKAELEAIAGENQVTDVTAEMLYELCKLLDEVC